LGPEPLGKLEPLPPVEPEGRDGKNGGGNSSTTFKVEL